MRWGDSLASKSRLTVNLSDGELAALGDLALSAKVSIAWLGRQAIRELFERARANKEQLPLPLTGLKQGGRR